MEPYRFPSGGTCRICLEPGKRMWLEGEGGVTDISLHNAHVLLEHLGLPDRVSIYWDPLHSEGPAVRAVWEAPGAMAHTFTGFSWGYGGEGPRGLFRFLESIGARPEFMAGIGGWRNGPEFEEKVLGFGADYGAAGLEREG